jgi:hypothetical protein
LILPGDPATGLGDFELDLSSVKLRSERNDALYLPYCGALPPQFMEPDAKYLYINVGVGMESYVMLVLDYGEKVEHFSLIAHSDEIVSLLDQLFYKVGCSSFDHGALTDYYAGYWQGRYDAWRKLTEEPRRLRHNIEEMTQARRDVLKSVVNRW